MKTNYKKYLGYGSFQLERYNLINHDEQNCNEENPPSFSNHEFVNQYCLNGLQILEYRFRFR